MFDQSFCFKHINLFCAPIRAFSRWLTNTLTHIDKHTHIFTHTGTCVKSMNMFSWGIFGAVWKGAVVRNCLLRWSGHLVEKAGTPPPFSTSLFALNVLAYFCSDRSIFPLVSSFSLLHQRFYMQKWSNVEPLYLSNESRFWKIKKLLLV